MKAYTNLHESILTFTRLYFFKRFSLRFLLFSSLSFLVNGLSLALLTPNQSPHRDCQNRELSLTQNGPHCRFSLFLPAIMLFCTLGFILAIVMHGATNFYPNKIGFIYSGLVVMFGQFNDKKRLSRDYSTAHANRKAHFARREPSQNAGCPSAKPCNSSTQLNVDTQLEAR